MNSLKVADYSNLQRALRIVFVCISLTLLGVLGVLVALQVSSVSILLLSFVSIIGGLLIADFLSGMVHWGADTRGSEKTPIIGRSVIQSFRVHHVNQEDMTKHGFFHTNGDLAIALFPLETIALFFATVSEIPTTLLCIIMSSLIAVQFTNQIHKWAHQRQMPIVARWLQKAHLILPKVEHQEHHAPPHMKSYCITTGWLNAPLSAIHFFEALERGITAVTGVQAREYVRLTVSGKR